MKWVLTAHPKSAKGLHCSHGHSSHRGMHNLKFQVTPLTSMGGSTGVWPVTKSCTTITWGISHLFCTERQQSDPWMIEFMFLPRVVYGHVGGQVGVWCHFYLLLSQIPQSTCCPKYAFMAQILVFQVIDQCLVSFHHFIGCVILHAFHQDCIALQFIQYYDVCIPCNDLTGNFLVWSMFIFLSRLSCRL